MNAGCKSRRLRFALKPAIRLWMGESDSFRDSLLQNQSRAFVSCSVECSYNGRILQEYSRMCLTDTASRSRAVLMSFSKYCTTDECVKQGQRAVTIALDMMNKAFVTAAPSFTNFADRGISLAGIIVCSVFLILLVVLVILGLLWKTFFGRIIWILLIVGIFGIVSAHLYVWIQSFLPNQVDINAPASLTSVIGYAVGFVARLMVLSMILVLLYFFLQQKLANVIVRKYFFSVFFCIKKKIEGCGSRGPRCVGRDCSDFIYLRRTRFGCKIELHA